AERFAADEAETKFAPSDPFADGAMLGPLSSKAQVDRVQGYIQKGIDEGAKLVTGGPGKPEGLNEDGYFVRPTVFSEVRNDMTIAQEEIFGPVLSIIAYQDEEDAAKIANDSVYGLAGGVWSADPERAKAFARRSRTGQSEINGSAVNPNAPFGGYKNSGYGREYGEHGFEEFLEVKSMQLWAVGRGDGRRRGRPPRRARAQSGQFRDAKSSTAPRSPASTAASIAWACS